MDCCILLFIILLIFSASSANHALEMEEVIGGYKAHESNHKYHAAIVGKYNHSDYRHRICNGAIIGNFYILSAQYCFFTKNMTLRRLTFFVIVGSVQITANYPREYEIEKFIMAGFEQEPFSNELIVSTLKESLKLNENPNLESLEIPYPGEKYPISALAAGFGAHVYDPTDRGFRTVIRYRITLGPPVNLTYAFVEISPKEDCKNYYNWNPAERLMYLCGVIKTDMHYTHRGFCIRDSGAPLVRDGKLYGILKKNRKDCNDTGVGAVYVRTQVFKAFIDAVMFKNYNGKDFSPIVIPNRLHAYRMNLRP